MLRLSQLQGMAAKRSLLPAVIPESNFIREVNGRLERLHKAITEACDKTITDERIIAELETTLVYYTSVLVTIRKCEQRISRIKIKLGN